MTNGGHVLPEIGIVDYPGAQLAMVHGLTDLLQIASDFSVECGGIALRLSHWRRGDHGGFVRTHDSNPGIDGCPAVLIAPGRLAGPLGPEDAAPYARWMLDRHAHGAVLASVCGGAFILAATGLLSGRPATTHWTLDDAFRTRFPNVRLDTDKIVIEDGDIITAGGLMAWTDLGLKLADRFLGPSAMIKTSRHLLIDPVGREQKHYSSFAPRLGHGDEAVLRVQHWLQAKGGHGVSVSDMASQAAMEERTFLRRFRAATGLKPLEYCQHLRVGKAREILEFTNRPVEQIAWSVGYEDPGAFRKVFHKVMGLSPGDYRQRFGAVQREALAA